MAFASLFGDQMIGKIRELLAEKHRADAIDLVYDTLDDLLLDGQIDAVRNILTTIPLDDSLPLSICLSVLTVTKPWRDQLPERESIRLFCSSKLDIGTL